MLREATPKIGDRVNKLIGNIQKKLCDGGCRGQGGRRENEQVSAEQGAKTGGEGSGVHLQPQVRS